MQDLDWKGDSAVLAAILASLGLLRRILAPYAVKQMQEAMAPTLDKMLEELAAIREEQDAARDRHGEIGDRLSHVEGIIERRRQPR